VNPVLQRLGAKTAEHHAMHRPDPGAGQHRDRRLRHHRKIDHHPVPFLYPLPPERVGKAANFVMQLLVGQDPDIPRFPLKNNRRLVPTRSVQMPVQAVVAEIQPPATKPFRKRLLPLQHLLGILEPGQLLLRHLAPKLLRVLHRLPVHRLVLGRTRKDRLLGEGSGGSEFRICRHLIFLSSGPP